MNPQFFSLLAAATFMAASVSHATEISIPDYSLTPNGLNETTTFQHTDVKALNANTNVLPSTDGTVVYVISTFTFGASSDAHLQWQFSNSSTVANRLGIEINDQGVVSTLGTGAGGLFQGTATKRSAFTIAQDMAGQTITMVAKLHYDANNSVTYDATASQTNLTPSTGDDTLMNVWINPNNASVEGSGISAGNLYAVWNSTGFTHFRQTIQNQLTPGTAGSSSITNTKILTGTDATWEKALLAAGVQPPSAIVDAATSTVSASPTAVPANGTSTSTITVTLKNASGIPVAGKEVSLAGNASATIQTSNNISNASGVVTFTVKSSATGMEQFTATDVTDSNLVITQTAMVDFQAVVPVGPVSASNSTVLASQNSILANGFSSCQITVTLRDSNDALIIGEGVTLSGSPAIATINPSGALSTSGSGQAIFTITSSAIGSVAFTATSSTNGVVVTQTATVELIDPATATAYNVNFLDEGQSNLTDQFGVAGNPGETWNQGTTSVSNLVDSTGAVTSTVSVSGLGSDGRFISTGTLNVFKGVRNILDKGANTTMSITGLNPNTPYDIYIYALSHNPTSWGDLSSTERGAGDFVTSNTVLGNGQSQFLDNAISGTNASSFVLNGNYVFFQSIVSNGSGNISIVVDAYDGIDGNPANDDGDCRLHVNALQIRPASGASVDYTAWRRLRYPSLGLPNADDDGDGLTNEYERIFGLNPTSSASNSPILGGFDPATGSLSYSRRSAALSNKNYQLWYSTNLQDWWVDNAAYQQVQSTSNDVEVVNVMVDPSLLGESKLFVQMRASEVKGIDLQPQLLNLWGGGNTMTLLFSEPMNPSALGNMANYTVQQTGGGSVGITGATVNSGDGSVTLTLDAPLGLSTNYTVTINGVTSGTGQAVPSNLSRQFKTWDNNPNGIKVFILAGQSNMVGFGSVETGNGGTAGGIGSMRYLAVNDASYPDYNYASLLVDPLQPTTSPFKNRSDVKVWWRNGGNGNLGGAIEKGDLGPPYRGRDTGKIGPEFAFGQVIGDFYATEDVLIIKCAWGGRSLGVDFRPPTAVSKRGGQVGVFYNAIINQTREILDNIGTQFPEWAGRGYEVTGFAWHQGYNDRIDASLSAEYKDNLPDLITDVRSLFSKPNLPFTIATTSMANVGPVEAAPYTNYTAVEKAQLWVAGVAKPANVASTDARGFWRGVAVSPSDQGHHWNWNAESYFLIGKALGDTMQTLLTP